VREESTRVALIVCPHRRDYFAHINAGVVVILLHLVNAVRAVGGPSDSRNECEQYKSTTAATAAHVSSNRCQHGVEQCVPRPPRTFIFEEKEAGGEHTENNFSGKENLEKVQ
jgi:hypothetical protein